MTREDGIIMVQVHSDGRPAIWARPVHRAVHMAIRDIASDPENKVLIFTCTGDYWIAYSYDTSTMQKTGIDESDYEGRRTATIKDYTGDAIPLQENLIFDLNIPSIALINGPGYHMDMALQCDLAICTDDTVMFDVHKHFGFISGDGVNISMKELMGSKRAAYYMLTGEHVTAQQGDELHPLAQAGEDGGHVGTAPAYLGDDAVDGIGVVGKNLGANRAKRYVHCGVAHTNDIKITHDVLLSDRN